MKRFVVLVLDSFGIGEMDDVKDVRPQDIGANTYRSVLRDNPNLKIPNLERLGIANAAKMEIGNVKFSKDAVYGRANLMHFWCDTFYGHHELMGTYPKKPKTEPFSEAIDEVEKVLKNHGYSVERFGSPREVLIVNNCATIGDNLEADLGQVYNITGALDFISYENLLEIGKIVRGVVKVPRVITFGGKNVTIEDLKNAYECRDGLFGGINAPKSGVYRNGYQVQHMGYGIDSEVQLPKILEGVAKTVFIGKVADIVENPKGKSIFCVDSAKVMELLIEEIKSNENAFICANIQETDLAGHQEDPFKYGEKLEVVDRNLKKVIDLLDEDDILIITADHGNDPDIGHSNHTREKVPILIYKKGLNGIDIGERGSLSDIGQSVAEYFERHLPDNGESFLKKL
ncbi:phosphopentomutase [Cetobacterium somerae]|uniref:phosphopentomutase n=1 Tax=Cetobacterium sp. NK01 TaxID=2993530 RepID=UPI002116DA9D|nr:phosphopentomutase [Cetobacterium sp. NK01]MCQ8212733.1 phosphopentomutase [Cetobacterium sp. NK01]